MYCSTCKDWLLSAPDMRVNKAESMHKAKHFKNRNLKFCGCFIYCALSCLNENNSNIVNTVRWFIPKVQLYVWVPLSCTPAPSSSLSGCSRVWLLQAVVSHAGYWPGVHLRKPQPSSVWIQSHEVYSAQIVLQLSGSALSAHNWSVSGKARCYYFSSRIEHNIYRAA